MERWWAILGNTSCVHPSLLSVEWTALLYAAYLGTYPSTGNSPSGLTAGNGQLGGKRKACRREEEWREDFTYTDNERALSIAHDLSFVSISITQLPVYKRERKRENFAHSRKISFALVKKSIKRNNSTEWASLSFFFLIPIDFFWNNKTLLLFTNENNMRTRT